MATYNHHVITLFILQALICITAAVANAVYTTTEDDWCRALHREGQLSGSIRYLDVNAHEGKDGGEVALDALKVVGTLLLQFTYFVPISLLVIGFLLVSDWILSGSQVTLEIVKFFQAKFINEDKNMVSGGKHALYQHWGSAPYLRSGGHSQ